MKDLLPKTVRVRVPPIKSQGIKTKIVPLILSSISWDGRGRWIEPFAGSGAVVFNVIPQKAVIADTNEYIIGLYTGIQNRKITSVKVRQHLEREGDLLLRYGEDHYYAIRDRFNNSGDPLDFLFLNRSCFNGVIRFNKNGKFNVPFCKKPDRFRQAYVTKICNQVAWIDDIIKGKDWEFRVQRWRDTISESSEHDFMYVDPPYIGRHTDYYNNWTEVDADDLAERLQRTECGFAYSMWLEKFSGFPMFTFSHFYHVGPGEDLRNSMEEALIVSHRHAVDKNETAKLLEGFTPVDDTDADDVQQTELFA